MARDTVGLYLSGDVPFSEYIKGMSRLYDLIHALSSEVAGDEVIEWEVSRLEGGSATTEVRGIAAKPDTVLRVIKAYSVVSEALEKKQQIPYSDAVGRHARALTELLNGKITAVNLYTDDYSARIEDPVFFPYEEDDRSYSIGVLSGTIETIFSRKGIRCTLYDDLFDKAVNCFLSREQQEELRMLWGRKVRIIGEIEREPETGRPMIIRNVSQIEEIPEEKPGLFLSTRGLVPWKENDEPSENTLRRLRDDF